MAAREQEEERDVELLLDESHISDPGTRDRPEILGLRRLPGIGSVVHPVRDERGVRIQVSLLFQERWGVDDHLIHAGD